MRGKAEDDFAAQLALMEAYDQEYGVFDHEGLGDADPMAIIGLHPAEDPISGSQLSLTLREIIATRLPELTNTPLMELLNLPRWFLDGLMAEARKNRQEEDRLAADVKKQAEQLDRV